MSSSPSQFSDFGQSSPAPGAPRRTSALAVTSLVVSLLALPCCFLTWGGAAISAIALMMGISACVSIASSQGRLKGIGFAGTGVVFSLVGIGASAVFWVAVHTMVDSLSTYGKFLTTAQSDDPSSLEAMLTPAAANEATSEGIAKFRTTLNDKWGAYTRTTSGAIPFFKGVTALAPIENSLPAKYAPSGTNPLLPVPCEFAKGDATVLFFTDPASQTTTLPLGRLRNVAVILPDGSLLWFIDPATPATPENPAPPSKPSAKPPATGG